MIVAMWQDAIAQIPRLLGLINRVDTSPTYGIVDRAYWHYRQRLFASARFQEAVLSLATVYTTNLIDNPYYKDEEVLSVIRAIFRATCRIQHYDGSFDEWYVGERSFVATAFVLAAHADALTVLEEELRDDRDDILRMLEKGALWLLSEDSSPVRNQESGAIYAMLRVGVLADSQELILGAKKRMQYFLKTQHEEGWWDEYGGPDIGYLSLTVHYLANYYEIDKDGDVLDAMSRACQFIEDTMHADGVSGGTVFSRNTEYLVPSGFAKLASRYEVAARLLGIATQHVVRSIGVRPSTLDDRYLCSILYNWLLAGASSVNGENVFAIQNFPDIKKYFSGAGIFIVRKGKTSLVLNEHKGGAFRIVNDDGVYNDAGLVIRAEKKVYYSGVFGSCCVVNGSTRKITGRLARWKESTMTRSKYFMLSCLAPFLRIRLLRKIAKRLLRAQLIAFSGNAEAYFERSFICGDGVIEVIDECFGVEGAIVWERSRVGLPAFIPSAKLVGGLALPSISVQQEEDGVRRKRVFHSDVVF